MIGKALSAFLGKKTQVKDSVNGGVSLAELLSILKGSSDEMERDDAAVLLIFESDWRAAENALKEVIFSSSVSTSLLETCAESLATIWLREGQVNELAISSLPIAAGQIIDRFLNDVELSEAGSNPPHE